MNERRIDRKTKIIIFAIITLILSLALLIAVLASKGKHAETPTAPEAAAEKPPGSLTYQPVTSITGPVNESDSLLESPFVGSFENSYVALSASDAKDIFGGEIPGPPPVLTIEENGSFILTINANEAGMLAVKGSVSVDGDVAVFTIEAWPAIDFLGADADSFTMRLLDKDDLRYSGEQIGTITKGDVFTRVSG